MAFDYIDCDVSRGIVTWSLDMVNSLFLSF